MGIFTLAPALAFLAQGKKVTGKRQAGGQLEGDADRSGKCGHLKGKVAMKQGAGDQDKDYQGGEWQP